MIKFEHIAEKNRHDVNHLNLTRQWYTLKSNKAIL